MSRNAPILLAAAGLLILIAVSTILYLVPSPHASAASQGLGSYSPETRQYLSQRHTEVRGLINKAEFNKAQSLLQRLADQYPADHLAHNLLARIWIARAEMYPNRAEQFQQNAYDAFMRSLELKPDQPDTHFTAAKIAYRLDHLDDAQHHYQRAVELNPDSAKYALDYAQLLFKRGDLAASREHAQRALELDASAHQARKRLSDIAAERGDLDAALKQLDAALEQVDHPNPWFLAYIVRKVALLRQANNPEEALNVLLSLPGSLRGGERSVTEQIAKTHLALEQPAKAAQAWAAWFNNHPLDAAAAANAGLAFLRSDQPERARAWLDKAERVQAHNPAVQTLARKLGEG